MPTTLMPPDHDAVHHQTAAHTTPNRQAAPDQLPSAPRTRTQRERNSVGNHPRVPRPSTEGRGRAQACPASPPCPASPASPALYRAGPQAAAARWSAPPGCSIRDVSAREVARRPAGGFVRCSSSSTRRARSRLWAAAPPRRSTPVTRQAGTPSTTWGADRCGKPAHPGRGMVAVSDCLCPARSVFAGARRTRAEPIRLTAAFDDDPAFLSQASRAGLPAPGLQSRASCAGAS
jgi:hypothetical protein